jgi:hypothetical protein
LHQHAVNPRPRRSHARWAAKTPEQKAAYGSEYRWTRDRVVAQAIGTPCPGCGVTLTRRPHRASISGWIELAGESPGDVFDM